MPRPPTDSYWVERIKAIVANEPRVTVVEIERRLEEHARAVRRTDVPRGNTIRRIRARVDGEDLRAYRFVYWPESFERGDLPWESAPTVLELMREHFEEGRRPPVRLAYWYWRVRQANPNVNAFDTLTLSMLLGTNPESAARQAEAILLGHQPPDGELGVPVLDALFLEDLKEATE